MNFTWFPHMVKIYNGMKVMREHFYLKEKS